MPLPGGFMKPSASPRRLSCPSANCSNGRGIMNTKMITLCRLDPAFTRSVPLCGNLILPSQQPRNGWTRGNSSSTCGIGLGPSSSSSKCLRRLRNLADCHQQIMEIPQKIKDYIDSARIPLPPVTDPDEPLQIDSLGLIRLVAFLESDLGIQIEDEELLADNFASLGAITKLLKS